MSEGADITILRRFDQDTLTKRTFPKRLFAGAIALTALAVLGNAYAGYRIYDGAKSVASSELRLRQLTGTIARLEEQMSTSVRMSVVTGDVVWEKRFREQEAAQAAAIKESTTLAPEAYALEKVVQARAADARLTALDNEAFALVRSGRSRDAMAVLSTAWCDEQRAIHAAGFAATSDALQARSTAMLEGVAWRSLLALLGCIAATLAAGAAWWRFRLATRKDSSSDVQEVLRQTKERLELHVKERGRALDDKNREMRLVLDNVDQGLLILDANGVIGAQRSAIVNKWFDRSPSGMTLWDLVSDVDSSAGALAKLTWEQLKADIMPIDLTLDMMPKKIVIGANVFEVAYQPIMTRGSLDHLLVIMSDATPKLERERLESEQRELMSIFEQIVKDKAGVIAFTAELKELVEKATAKDVSIVDRRRYIHTLKGNCGMFGASHLATLCHQIEDRMNESEGLLSDRDRRLLADAWANVSKKLEVLVGTEGKRAIEVDERDYAAVIHALRSGASTAEVAQTMAAWTLEPVRNHFARFGARARTVAERLGKGDVVVTEDDGDIRLDGERWAPFWGAFVHVVANAVDHGVETPEERELAGKPGCGQIALRAFETVEDFVIELSDDGRGVDWDAVATKAKACGLSAGTPSDLVEALFADGLSTKEAATDISGRGAGLGAVRQECRRLGGTVDVSSRVGEGTRFRFRFPRGSVSTRLAKAA